MSLKKRDLERVFNKLEMETRSTHHVIAWFTYKGRKIVKTRVSFGRGDVPEKVVHKIRGQLKLNVHDFDALVKCPLGREEYITILQSKGLIAETDG